MSHTLKVKAKFTDPKAVEAAAKEMGAEIVRGKLKLHQPDSAVENGFGVKLPGWRLPVIINTQTGEASYDNYKGRWGAESELHKFTQLYATHKATLFAKSKGLLVTRTTQANGSIKLQLSGAL